MPNTHSTLTSLFSDIADAIRGKTGSSATIVADDFPTAIANIPTGSGGVITTEVANATGTTLVITSSESTNIQSLSVTENGTYTAGDGVDGYSPVVVDVQSGGSVVTRAVSFTYNDADAMFYTDATMTPQSITSGNRDLDNVQLPIGSLVVYVRTGVAEPMPFPSSSSGVSQLASYTIGSDGEVIIYQVLPTPQGYTVQVSLTNPVNTGYFSYCNIYTALSNDMWDAGEVLGQIDSPSSSTTVTVPLSAYGIIVQIDGVSPSLGSASATGGVTYISDDGYDTTIFQVTGDGTATLDGIDYDD